ncbi:rRNA maturation RNase YbeY [Aquimarina addita]|uniref:Endoribonuclease YbeY n=1 Tax=Aquimarina addita TaxID=870485 RepID=A0ABP7XAK2_9FLAO
MINFYYEIDELELDEKVVSNWIKDIIKSESKKEGELNFIFCNDAYLLKINQDFLNHDTYTDIITFDNSIGNELHSDVFISYERVIDNAVTFDVVEEEELRRVMAHGVLHLCGYKDKSDKEKEVMRKKEDEKLLMFHVEH